MSEPIDLAYLIHHYGEAYEISMRRRRYEARRRDDGTVLTADTAEDLLEKIREDYRAHPVPRRIEGTDLPAAAELPFPTRGLAREDDSP